jgi:hypothetical protein
VPKTLTATGHTEGCAVGAAQPSPDASHVDIFCEGYLDEPHILPNGTDVAWPGNWSRERADAWRKTHGLTRPTAIPAAGPHDQPELSNGTSTAGTGMLADAGSATDQDMAPGG